MRRASLWYRVHAVFSRSLSLSSPRFSFVLGKKKEVRVRIRALALCCARKIMIYLFFYEFDIWPDANFNRIKCVRRVLAFSFGFVHLAKGKGEGQTRSHSTHEYFHNFTILCVVEFGFAVFTSNRTDARLQANVFVIRQKPLLLLLFFSLALVVSMATQNQNITRTQSRAHSVAAQSSGS